MRALAACLLVLVPAVLPADDVAPEWTRFAPKGARCSVEMPGKPTTAPVQDITQAGVKTKLHMHILEADGGKVGYGLGYADFGANAVPDDKVKDVLVGAQGGTAKALKGKEVAARDVKLGKYLGREFTLELQGGNYYRARLYLVDGRLYQVIALGPKDFVNGTGAKAFLYSFELAD